MKYLIWDFDGTLYRHNPGLSVHIRDAEYQTILKHHPKWTKEKAIASFEKIYKVVTPSATEAIAMICNIPTPEAAVEMESYYDRKPFLARDPQLVSLFAKLSDYAHYILANGARGPIAETLGVLGLPKSLFEEIVTSEVVGVNKPHTDGFYYIMKQTKLPAEVHMMIGDREAVDLVPAKSIGMKTCLVWSHAKSLIADVVLPTVYDVVNILSR